MPITVASIPTPLIKQCCICGRRLKPSTPAIPGLGNTYIGPECSKQYDMSGLDDIDSEDEESSND